MQLFFHFLSLLKLPLENLKNALESAKIILLKTKNMPKNELFHQIHLGDIF